MYKLRNVCITEVIKIVFVDFPPVLLIVVQFNIQNVGRWCDTDSLIAPEDKILSGIFVKNIINTGFTTIWFAMSWNWDYWGETLSQYKVFIVFRRFIASLRIL